MIQTDIGPAPTARVPGPSSAPAGDPWSKPVVSMRLSAARASKLAKIASLDPRIRTPAAAIDAAIERAAAPLAPASSQLMDRLDEIEEAVDRAAGEARAGGRAGEAAARQAASASNAVYELIAAASGRDEPDRADAVDAPGTALPLAVWLRGDLAAAGAPKAGSAIARLVWTGSRATGEARAAVFFDASIAAIDGRQSPAGARARAVQVDGVGIGGPLFAAIAANASRPLFAVARHDGEDWRWTLFASAASGDAAELLGELFR